MTVCVVDSHALLWYLTDSPRLGKGAVAALENPQTELVIPTMALAELKHLHERRRIPASLSTLKEMMVRDQRCSTYPLDEDVVDAMPAGLEIHDGIICATALVLQALLGTSVKIITRDEQITNSRCVETIW
jgi:PIN domain nuclease of toxin-antitoxin system